MKKNKYLKWLNYKTYEFGPRHSKSILDEDSKTISVVAFIVFIIMSALLISILLFPDLRYDSGVDNLPILLFGVAGSISCFILAKLPIKNDSVFIIERYFVRFYFSVLFSVVFVIEFLYFDSKLDAVFVYLIYCAISTILLHMNPISYAIQTIIITSITSPTMIDYFDSFGAFISYIVLMFTIVCLVFRSNIIIHKKLNTADRDSDDKKMLEDALRERTNEVMSGIQRQTAIQENVILAIADLVENRDTDTGTHIKATSYYAKLIAENARTLNIYTDQITDEFIYLVEKSAPMHDLGKIVIPDDILKAPRRLTTEEFEIMKRHTIEGSRIIRHVYDNIETREYINCAANIAHYHHERWDGNGYPCGKSGCDIPLEARIMAIADVFDALVSKRCYKDAYPLSHAFSEIEKNSGTQFDPSLVSAFIASKTEIENMIVNDFGK